MLLQGQTYAFAQRKSPSGGIFIRRGALSRVKGQEPKTTVINPIRVFPQSRLDIAGVNSALFSLLLRLVIGYCLTFNVNVFLLVR